MPQILRRRAVAGTPRVAARRDDGSILTASELPDSHGRWTSQRTRVVGDCIDLELISAVAAERRYRLSGEELAEWRELARAGRSPEAWASRPRRVEGGRLRAGGLEVDLDGRSLAAGGQAVRLSDAEWAILRALAEAGGAVVSNAMLMGLLYPNGRLRSRKILDVLVCRMRQKAGAEGAAIEAVWGRGYRLAVGPAARALAATG